MCGTGYNPKKEFVAPRIEAYKEHGIGYRWGYTFEDFSPAKSRAAGQGRPLRCPLAGRLGRTCRAIHGPARWLPGGSASSRARDRGTPTSLGHDAERRSGRTRLPTNRTSSCAPRMSTLPTSGIPRARRLTADPRPNGLPRRSADRRLFSRSASAATAFSSRNTSPMPS